MLCYLAFQNLVMPVKLSPKRGQQSTWTQSCVISTVDPQLDKWLFLHMCLKKSVATIPEEEKE